METLVKVIALAATACLPCLQGGRALAEESVVPTYRAEYAVEYKGRRVGRSQFSVSHDAAEQIYRFESISTFRGLLKLVSPRPVVERSEFTYENGRVRPLGFSFQDGSRRGEDNFTVVFDWEAGLSRTTGDGWTTELELHPGVLDRGSLQVAVMIDMATPDGPGSYSLADEGTLKTYRYSDNGTVVLETAVGTVDTREFVQDREGSSRRTRVWAAPEHRYLPMRIEQQRNGETRTVFTLESVEWLDSNND